MKYEQIYDGQWWKLEGRTYKLMCCDCSLVHHIAHRVNADKTIDMKFETDRRATRRARERYGITVKRKK